MSSYVVTMMYSAGGRHLGGDIHAASCGCCAYPRRLITSSATRERLAHAIHLRHGEDSHTAIDLHKLPYETTDLSDDDVPASLISRVARCAEVVKESDLPFAMRRSIEALRSR